MASERTGWFRLRASKGRGSLIVAVAVLAIALGSCVGIDAHQANGGAQTDPCDVEPVSIKAGVERLASPERMAPGLMPSIPDATVTMHCGTPDAPTPVIAVAAISVSPHAPRAPPLG